MGTNLLRLLGLAAWLLASWGAGLTILRILRVPPAGPAARGALAVGLVLGLDALLALALGAAGLLGWGSTLAIGVLQAALAVPSGRELRAALVAARGAPRWLLLPLLLGLPALLMALAPPVAYDAANEHYPLSKIPAREGALEIRDELRYSANGGLHGLYMLAFTIGREEEANLAWVLLVGLIPLAAYAAGRELFSPRAGVVTAFLSAAFPYANCMNLSTMDKPAALFLFLACLAAAKARESGGAPWAALAGFFSGLCVQARPTCAPAVAVPLLLLLSRRLDRRGFLALAGAFLLAAAPWRAAVWMSTGSPFPLSHPASELAEWAGARGEASLLARHGFFLGSLLLPLSLGPAAFAGAASAIALRRRPAAANALLAAAAAGLAIYYLGTMSLGSRLLAAPFHVRYFSAFSIPITSLLGAWAWDRLLSNGRPLRWGLAAALALQLAFVGLSDLRRVAVAWPVLTGRMDRDAFLRGAVGPYAGIEHLNRAVRPGERVLYAGLWQGFLEVRYRYVDQALHARIGRDEYLSRMKQAGARHLAVLRGVADRLELGAALRETYRDEHLVVYETP